jgi:signal transduction histidine kinase
MDIPPVKNLGWLVLVIIGLVALQVVWWSRSFGSAQREFDQGTRIRLQEVARAIEQDAECFEMTARREIPKGGRFFLLIPNGDDPGRLDTLESFYWEHTPKDTAYPLTDLELSAPASVEVTQRFTFLKRVEDQLPDSMSKLEQRVARSYARAISRRQGSMQYKVLDTLFLSAMVDSELTRPDVGRPEYAVAETRSGALLHTSAPRLSPRIMRDGMVQVLFADRRFTDPLSLYVLYPGERTTLLWSFAPMAVLFVLMIGLLVLMLWYFTRSLRQQRKLVQMRIDLVNNITHEFNTPIANIGLAIDTLERHGTSPELLTRTELTDIIRSENHRLKRNVEKVMETCRLEAGQVTMEHGPIDLHQLLTEVARNCDPALSNAYVTVVMDLKADHPVVTGDRTYLGNVLFGLIDNAIKYGQPGNSITISTDDHGSEVVLEVADKGPGIRPEDLHLVFEKFFRTNVKDLHDVKGTGLGLYLARRIVTAHSGRIDARNNADGGATIRIQLARAHHGTNGRETVDRRGRPQHGKAPRSEPAFGRLFNAAGPGRRRR